MGGSNKSTTKRDFPITIQQKVNTEPRERYRPSANMLIQKIYYIKYFLLISYQRPSLKSKLIIERDDAKRTDQSNLANTQNKKQESSQIL